VSGIVPELRSIAVSEKARKKPVYIPEFNADAVAKCSNIGINATSRSLVTFYPLFVVVDACLNNFFMIVLYIS
jgi:hypothetical protein